MTKKFSLSTIWSIFSDQNMFFCVVKDVNVAQEWTSCVVKVVSVAHACIHVRLNTKCCEAFTEEVPWTNACSLLEVGEMHSYSMGPYIVILYFHEVHTISIMFKCN